MMQKINRAALEIVLRKGFDEPGTIEGIIKHYIDALNKLSKRNK
jgi:hypothetical protein